jgi:hypothetical protein
LSGHKYSSHSKYVGAVGENNFVIQFINSGAKLAKEAASWFLHHLVPKPVQVEPVVSQKQLVLLSKQVEISQKIAEIHQRQLELNSERAEREKEGINLAKQLNSLQGEANQLQKEFIACTQENSELLRDLIQQYLIESLDRRAEELQNSREHYNALFCITFENIKRLLQHNYGLLLILSPPQVSSEIEGFGDLDREIQDAVEDVIQVHYSSGNIIYPVEFPGLILKRSVNDLEAAYVRFVFIPRPTLIFSSRITERRIYLTITYPIDKRLNGQNLRGNQPTLTIDWEEIVDQVKSEGKTQKIAIRAIRELITTIHMVMVSYFSDLYYLSFDPLYEPHFFQLIKEFPPFLQILLTPYSHSLRQIQTERKIEVLEAKAQQAISTHDYEISISIYRELIKLTPQSSRYYYNLGDAIFYLVNSRKSVEFNNLSSYYFEAEKIYGQAFKLEDSEISRSNYEFILRFADILKIMADNSSESDKVKYYQTALDYYTKIIKFAEINVDFSNLLRDHSVWFKRGLISFIGHDFNASYSDFNKAITLHPDSYLAWFYRGISARRLGYLNEAVVSLFKVFENRKDAWESEWFIHEVKNLSKAICGQIFVKSRDLLVKMQTISTQLLEKFLAVLQSLLEKLR